MSEQAGKPPCDIDDLRCQLQVMNHLEGLHNILGKEKYAALFPELQGLGPVIEERMKTQETTIREAYERCGLEAPKEEIEYHVQTKAVIEGEEE